MPSEAPCNQLTLEQENYKILQLQKLIKGKLNKRICFIAL